MKPKPVVFDLDDLCDQWDPWDDLHRWKEKNPNGKVTLFTIPRRTSDGLIRKYADLDWVQLVPHGWWHARGECLYWTSEDTVQRLRYLADRGYERGFRAPKWLITDEVYRGLEAEGWWVADHRMNRHVYEAFPNVRRYVYNVYSRSRPFRALHGHTHDVCDNGINEAFDTFCSPPDTPYLFVSEVVSDGYE